MSKKKKKRKKRDSIISDKIPALVNLAGQNSNRLIEELKLLGELVALDLAVGD